MTEIRDVVRSLTYSERFGATLICIYKHNMTTESSSRLRDQLVAAVLKKRAALARTHQIVVALIEPNIEEQTFLAMLAEIDPHNYADIVDERHINKLCGYPLCAVAVEKVPAKQYQICGVKNKVYDLTERKKFCSGHCFKASEYIKSQISTSPLWLRDKEKTPNFKLLLKT